MIDQEDCFCPLVVATGITFLPEAHLDWAFGEERKKERAPCGFSILVWAAA